ncbi:MAG: hypothetical protein KAS32_03145 [Candidatus Peribacteraceae bacterium]|nr:hypothetical protein [Candidatus Peribacteraceae bacterium]
MADTDTPEKGKSIEGVAEQKTAFIVSQPHKLEGLLDTISLMDKVSERIGESKAGDLGGGGVATGGTQTDDTTSDRKKALANLPEPKVMQKKLEKQILIEIKKLNKEVKYLTRLSKAGKAYDMNETYSRIRRLNDLLHDLLNASFDVMKRLYVRIFIDKQDIL